MMEVGLDSSDPNEKADDLFIPQQRLINAIFSLDDSPQEVHFNASGAHSMPLLLNESEESQTAQNITKYRAIKPTAHGPVQISWQMH